MKEFLSVWGPVFVLYIIGFCCLHCARDSYYDQGYKEASQGVPYEYCPTHNQFAKSWKNGWNAYQRDSFLDSREVKP